MGTLNFVNQVAQLSLFLLLFVALLLKVNLDGDSSRSFYSGIVSCLAVVPVALPLVLKAFIKLAAMGTEQREEYNGGANDAEDDAEDLGFGDEE